MTPMPLAERIERLTAALVNDPSGPAAEELSSVLSGRLTLVLQHRWRKTDADAITDAVHDAILDHISHANRSAGIQGNAILSRVIRATWCPLKNRVRSDQARVRRERAYAGSDRERIGADVARRMVELCMRSPDTGEVIRTRQQTEARAQRMRELQFPGNPLTSLYPQE